MCTAEGYCEQTVPFTWLMYCVQVYLIRVNSTMGTVRMTVCLTIGKRWHSCARALLVCTLKHPAETVLTLVSHNYYIEWTSDWLSGIWHSTFKMCRPRQIKSDVQLSLKDSVYRNTTHIHIHTHAHTHPHTHACTHAHTPSHTCTRTHMRTHAHMQTHAHTQGDLKEVISRALLAMCRQHHRVYSNLFNRCQADLRNEWARLQHSCKMR